MKKQSNPIVQSICVKSVDTNSSAQINVFASNVAADSNLIPDNTFALDFTTAGFYEFKSYLNVYQQPASGNAKPTGFIFDFTANTSNLANPSEFSVVGLVPTSFPFPGFDAGIVVGPPGFPTPILLEGYIVISTPGSLTLRWGVGLATDNMGNPTGGPSTNTVVMANSYMVATLIG